MVIIDRYHNALNQVAPPGHGCHTSLLSLSNMGVRAGLDAEQIFQDIREHIPKGNRYVPDKEIQDAINKALSDHSGGTFTPRPQLKPIVNDGKATLQKIIEQGKIITEIDLIKASPIPIPDEPKRATKLLIETLFRHDDLIFIGERHDAGILGETIKNAVDWLTYFIEGGETAPHIIVNPLTGSPATKKAGDGETLRGDGNVKNYRYCLIEFDNLTREDQIRFWSAVRLPIVCLIDSGGKSIHAWLQVSEIAKVKTSQQWQTEIKGHLYELLLKPLGVDSACSNPARLSRLPGHYREEKGTYQKLLWLSPTGRSIL